jgi:acetamidase/formamidase
VITSESQLPTDAVFGGRLLRDELNACAGPVVVSGALPGDVLAVDIHKIQVADHGVTCIFEGVGPLADSYRYAECRGPYTKLIAHRAGASGTTTDGDALFSDQVRWPLRPHIGTIAVAPARPYSAGADGNYGQGRWGGNLDSRDLCPGNRVFLQVEVEGAYLYLGDVHGTMADGELYGTANETAAAVTLSCEVLSDRSIPFVRIESPESIIQLNSYRPLDDAIADAFIWMLDWLVNGYHFSSRDAYLQLCLNPDVRINVYQMVKLGRLASTVGVAFPKNSLEYS